MTIKEQLDYLYNIWQHEPSNCFPLFLSGLKDTSPYSITTPLDKEYIDAVLVIARRAPDYHQEINCLDVIDDWYYERYLKILQDAAKHSSPEFNIFGVNYILAKPEWDRYKKGYHLKGFENMVANYQLSEDTAPHSRLNTTLDI